MAEVVDLWRSKVYRGLMHLLLFSRYSNVAAEVQRIYKLIAVLFFLLLKLLILADQTLLEDSRCDAELELVLLDVFVEELYDFHIGPLLLLDLDTDVASAHLVLLNGKLVLLRQLVEADVVWLHHLRQSIQYYHHLGALLHKLLDFLQTCISLDLLTPHLQS